MDDERWPHIGAKAWLADEYGVQEVTLCGPAPHNMWVFTHKESAWRHEKPKEFFYETELWATRAALLLAERERDERAKTASQLIARIAELEKETGA